MFAGLVTRDHLLVLLRQALSQPHAAGRPAEVPYEALRRNPLADRQRAAALDPLLHISQVPPTLHIHCKFHLSRSFLTRNLSCVPASSIVNLVDIDASVSSLAVAGSTQPKAIRHHLQEWVSMQPWHCKMITQQYLLSSSIWSAMQPHSACQ